MKAIKFLGIALLALTIVSCSKTKEQRDTLEKAEASNTSDAAEDVKTEPSPSYLASLQPEDILLPAQLKGKVEVLNGDDDCIPVELNNNNYPEITITFKLLGKVNTASLASAYGQLWIVGEAQDNAGRAVKDILPSYGEWRTDDSDGSEFKAFLESEPDETITLSFTGESNIELFEKDQSKIDAGIAKTTAACKKVGKFKLKITN